jgi:hypothetical protein
VNDTAARRRPHHVAAAEHALVAIAQLALDEKRRDLETGVRMRTSRVAARGKIDAVVHQNDERIVLQKVRGIHHLHGRMSFADEPRGGRRGLD